MIQIVPSILAADLTRLGEQVREVEAAGCQRVQVDVMDGHFVPNLTFGPDVVRAVKRAAPGLTVEVHLMVERPEQYVSSFASAGADYILVQVESTTSLYRTLTAIREAGPQPGLVLNPGTPVEMLRELLDLVPMVLVMTVEPGFGGQRFIGSSPAKIGRVRDLAPKVEIEVDGGIDAASAPLCAAAGATLLVAGSSVFGHPEGLTAGIRELRGACGS